MGQAKRHAKLRASMASYCLPLSGPRFNLFTIGIPLARVGYFEDVSYWSSPDERLIAVVGRDSTDNDFNWVLLARDAFGRFRFVESNGDYKSLSRAEAGLWQVMCDTIQTEHLIELGRRQAGETDPPIDLLRVPADRDPATLHPYFRALLEAPSLVTRRQGP
jgi:hypothetical protein